MKSEYWDKRYRGGTNSGEGSRGSYRKWKWKSIKRYVNVKDKNVLDVGCGDLAFLKGRKFGSYLGFDISPYMIAKNRGLRPGLEFAVKDVTVLDKDLPQFDVVLCMDLLFHIMDESGFVRLLENLNRWAGEWLFVINWSENPLAPNITDGEFQYYRNLTQYLDKLPALRLLNVVKKRGDPYNSLYVFKRRSELRDEWGGVLGLGLTDEERLLDEMQSLSIGVNKGFLE